MNSIIPANTVSFSFQLKVEEKHLDALNHVNNVVYLKWVNDISEKHWSLISNKDLNAKYVWVVLRHELDYVGEAKLGDEISIYTWVGETKGVKSVRHVHIYKEDRVLLRAASTWCLIDQKTLRPSRIKEDILKLLRP